MALRCVGVGRVRVGALTGILSMLALLAAADSAEARRGHHSRGHSTARKHVAKSGGYAPPFAAMVVDANSGRTLYAVDEDEPRHPASITKVMTLYMLFEQLERGTISLDSDLDVSSRAAAQAPSKIGLRPGATIKVEDAIKAVVTKSANDVAVVIAENVGGSEEEFAARMTRKARQLGMTGTVYRNASGLPNSEQITTAHDLTILARAIQEKFPRYYKYFQTKVFYYAGHPIPNHNRLLGRVEGVDGIKTGFTNASGFNLMTSARLDGRHLVGVVLGGRSGASRDNIMAGLIRTNFARATVGRTASYADASDDVPASAQRARRGEDIEATASTGVETRAPTREARPSDIIRPAVAAAFNGAGTATPSAQRAAPPLPPSASVLASAGGDLPIRNVTPPPGPSGKIEARLPTGPIVAATLPPARGEAIQTARLEPRTEPRAEKIERTEKAERAEKAESSDGKRDGSKPASVTPWVIQLAAEGDERQARAILDDARTRSGRTLAKAQPFTERVTRGGSTLFRARFSGFSEADSAQEACRTLKQRGFACFATRS